MFAFVVLVVLAGKVDFFEKSYGSGLEEHYKFGLDVGTKYKAQITTRYDESLKNGVLGTLMTYIKTEDGKRTFDTMLYVHNSTFPQYVKELEGISQGSGVSFEQIFAHNVREALDTIADPWTSRKQKNPDLLQCSDYVMYPYEAHNEDGGRINDGIMFFVNVTIDGGSFIGYTYPGDLTTGAFGFNSNHFGFTLNYVAPYAVNEHGIGRGFVSRDLLSAASIDDALDRLMNIVHATGHNFQLMDFAQKKITNVEVAPFKEHAIRELKAGDIFFHANAYLSLNVTQNYDQSSRHRLDRIQQLPKPTTPFDLLSALGDQEDKIQPIFHDEKSLEAGDQSGIWTLTTMLFNVENGTAHMYSGNPKLGNVEMIFTNL